MKEIINHIKQTILKRNEKKYFAIWAIKREAKSLKAQWLSTSGLVHNCLLTMHEHTDGMSSWSYNKRKNSN